MTTQDSRPLATMRSSAPAAAELALLRTRLLRHARFALHEQGLAEDLVQDTLIDIIEGADRRRGDASLSTWVTVILKHKIADWYRAPARRVMVQMTAEDESLGAAIDAQIDDQGAWAQPVPGWQQPEQQEERRQMMGALEDCLGRLPAQTGRVFVMREWLGFDTAEIAARLGLSAENIRQFLHRARLGLRGCMQQRWVGAKGAA